MQSRAEGWGSETALSWRMPVEDGKGLKLGQGLDSSLAARCLPTPSIIVNSKFGEVGCTLG